MARFQDSIDFPGGKMGPGGITVMMVISIDQDPGKCGVGRNTVRVT
jgi:hypothetical protein